jgi:hypothetical protein
MQIIPRLLGTAEVRRVLGREAMNEGAARVVQAAAKLAEQKAREGAPGHVASSIQADVKGLDAEVRSTLPEALPIETGRHAGARFPPPDALLGWAARHGFSGNVFVLARAIARRGIKGRFFMRAARDAVVRAWPQLTKEFGAPWQ